MTATPSSGPPKDASNLQFDRAVPASENGGAGTQAVVCASCASSVRSWYYDVDGAQFCAACKQKVERTALPIREWGPTMRAALFGLGAAIVGAIIYYGVIAITNFEIGIVAILIGYIVGLAVRKGASGRGGRRLQVVAAGLTYFSVAMAYFPLAVKGAIDGSTDDAQSSSIVADSTVSDDDAPNAAVPAESEPVLSASAKADDSKPNPVYAVGVLLAFSLALPLMVVFGTLPSGLISAIIIGIGMRQAWVMTRAADLTILGPFKVGAARAGEAPPPSAGQASNAA